MAVPVHAYVPQDPILSDLSEARKELIRAGHHAPYSYATVKRVQVLPQYKKPTLILGKLHFNEFEMQRTAGERFLINTLFWTAHLADVYTTYEGVKYECIREANPLLPSVPNINEMVILKGSVIWVVSSAFYTDEEYGELMWNEWKLLSGIITGAVAYNNYKLTKKAKGRCPKR